jgi:hypothetical protein
MKESETVGGMEGKQEGNAAEGTTGRVVGNSEGVSVVGEIVRLLVGMVVGFADGDSDGGAVITTVGQLVDGLNDGLLVGLCFRCGSWNWCCWNDWGKSSILSGRLIRRGGIFETGNISRSMVVMRW